MGKTNSQPKRSTMTEPNPQKSYHEIECTESIEAFIEELKNHVEISYLEVILEEPLSEDKYSKLVGSHERIKIQTIRSPKDCLPYYGKDIVLHYKKLVQALLDHEGILYHDKVDELLNYKDYFDTQARMHKIESRLFFISHFYFRFKLKSSKAIRQISIDYLDLTDVQVNQIKEVLAIHHEFYSELARLTDLQILRLKSLAFKFSKFKYTSADGKMVAAQLVLVLTQGKNPPMKLNGTQQNDLFQEFLQLFGLPPERYNGVLQRINQNKNPYYHLKRLLGE